MTIYRVLQEENDKLHARVTEQSDAMYSRDLAREESRRKIGELSKEVQQIRFGLGVVNCLCSFFLSVINFIYLS